MFDISGFYFHDAAVQTNGVDDPVKQRADTRIRLANNVRYFPSRIHGLRSPKLNLWDISIVKQVRISGRVRGAVQYRAPERVQSAGVQQPEYRPHQRRISAR